MRALVLDGPGGRSRLAVRELPPPPPPGPGEVLVRIRAAALNRLDVFMADGLPGPEPAWPHIVGTDGAGEVEAVGPGVEAPRPGDAVLLDPGIAPAAGDDDDGPLTPGYRIIGEHRSGTCAELVVVPARNCWPKPPAMGWAQAAAFPLATLTAWRMLATRAAVRPGETVLVWGAGGGVAQASIQVAAHLGATVIATSGRAAPLETARRLGAHATIDHATADVVAEVKRATGGRGADVVVDSVGEQAWPRSLRCLRRGGRLVICGATTGPMVQLDLRKLFWHQWTILGSTMGNRREFGAIVALAAEGKLWPVVDTVTPLAEGAAAFARLAEGAQAGKVVIEVAA
ncbi:MAG: zinc-binding dehydrogenase [Gemmatimonadales bacterium]|nr:zinc-binding dehydrogenase [Gemmatimonadales bacterium]